MNDSLPIRHRLPGISARAFEHPADRAATAALGAIPMMDRVVRMLTQYQYERALRQFYLANSVQLGPNQLPHIWDSYLQVLDTLDMPEQYDLYIMQTPIANAFTIGAGKPIIVLNSGLVTLLDEAQVQAVLAHEVGHILAEHVTYRTALLILLSIGQLSGLPLFTGLPILAIRLALLEWYRAAELSADRAATLVVRDPLIYCRTMMNLAGGGAAKDLNLDAFIQQASDYDAWDDNLDRGLRFFLEIGQTHPFPVQRVSELMGWVQSGAFDRIIRGDYPRREEQADPREEAGEAYDFYAERFRRIIDQSGLNVREFVQQANDWLRGMGRQQT